MTSWSYSSIKTFDQCPKKYYHLKVVKDVEDKAGPEAAYGVEAHKAAEDYIKDGTPVPEKFAFMRPVLEALKKIPGEKHTEIRFGVKKTEAGYEPCGFFDKGVWYRGIADLVIVNGTKARVIDYKTGKSAKYADTKQLDLMAGSIFLRYPEVTHIKAALIYVVSNDFIQKEYERDNANKCLNVFSWQLDRLDAAYDSGVFNPNSGPLCGWCPVVFCEHYRPRR
jgi:CRISPR/Cas system-associated exonuclease Cas4 (RecB family)